MVRAFSKLLRNSCECGNPGDAVVKASWWQVKSGHVNRGTIAKLKGDMEREKAEVGVFITLHPAAKPMRQEALSAGIYTPEHFPDQEHPRVQILTIDERLSGAPATSRQAPRRRRRQGAHSSLFYWFVDWGISSVGRAPALDGGWGYSGTASDVELGAGRVSSAL